MRVAVCGLGFMGWTHAGAWSRMPGAELYGVVSRDPRKLAGEVAGPGGNLGRDAVPLDFSKLKKFATLDDALQDPAIDAVDLCTPTDQHAQEVLSSLAAGKHVLVEKPIALTSALAEEMTDKAWRLGKVLMCAQVLRFMPAYVRAKELIQELGKVRTASFRRRCAAPAWSAWLADPQRSGGGAFDLLIHDIDYVRWVFGLPRSARAVGAVDRDLGIDMLAAELEYEDLTVGVSGGWFLKGEYPFSMEFTVVCEGGVLEYGFGTGALNLYRLGAAKEEVPLDNADPFELELAHFRDCVKEGKPSRICPPQQSGDSVKIMEYLIRARELWPKY